MNFFIKLKNKIYPSKPKDRTVDEIKELIDYYDNQIEEGLRMRHQHTNIDFVASLLNIIRETQLSKERLEIELKQKTTIE